ncbi:MAG: Hpt domain-containing protein [Pseudomonadota bacterium]
MDPRIDREALKRLLAAIGGNTADLNEILDDYRVNSPNLVETMRTAGANDDWDATRVAAHSLKSNARDIGARHLEELCADLERRCKEGGPIADFADVIAAIASAEADTRAALDAVSLGDLVS